jgi:glycosyltransferase family protein
MRELFKYYYLLLTTISQRKQFHRVKVKSLIETIDDIRLNQKSISRYGDGELKIMLNKGGVVFQQQSPELAGRLRQVLASDLDNLIIALPGPLCSVRKENLNSRFFWLRFINSYGGLISEHLDSKRRYGNAGISRFYLGLNDKRLSAEILKNLKKIWEQKEILIIEGRLTRMGVGNDLFANAASLSRVVCPPENAFEKYQEIFAAAQRHGEGKLILIALGPTATVLSHDLAKGGFWAIDIGHVDVEYMWMLSQAQTRIPIKGREVAELKGEKDFEIPEAYRDSYYESIVETVV